MAHFDHAVLVGDTLFAPDNDDPPCVRVVQVANALADGWDAIVSMPISVFESGRVCTSLSLSGTPDVILTQPPYPFLTDI